MGYDPKRPDWVNLASVEPSEFSGLDPIFSLRPVMKMLKRILGDELISLREIFSVSWPPEFSTVTLMFEDPLFLHLFRKGLLAS